MAMTVNRREGPTYCVLSEKKKDEIYMAALEVLRRTGIKVDVPEALALLKKAGCWVDGDRVRIPPHLIDWAIRTAPRRVTLCDREGNPALYLENGNSYYGTGGDCPIVIDPYTGERRPGKLQDVVDYARVADTLPNIDFVLNMAIAQDCNQKISDLYHFEAMVNNTTKPLLYSAWNVETLKAIIEMCEVIAGGAEAFRRSPFAILFGADVSPLKMTQEYTPLALYTAEKGLPLICAPSEIAGGTAPVTLAGAMVQGQAEILAMLLLVQLKREGTPFILSVCGPIPMDMFAMTASYASPEFALTMGGMAEMTHYYGLPIFGFAGCSDSKCFDEQASMEGALSLLVSGLSGANLIHDVGYIESGLTSCFEMLVVMDEMIGYVKRVLKGIEIDTETLALDVINRVGPGGEYLSDPHTYKYFRQNWVPGLLDRHSYGTWCEKGNLTLRQRAHEKVLNILKTYQAKHLDAGIHAKLSEIIARHKKN
jgi:trimethylamine--corrinoid protein Co-methyltransferase